MQLDRRWLTMLLCFLLCATLSSWKYQICPRRRVAAAALAAAKYYCMKNAAAAVEEEDTPASPFLFRDPSCWQEMHLSSAELVEPSLGSHLPWRPVNLEMSLQRQFHFPPALFTCLMKNWGVPEIIACELLHSGQNFREIALKMTFFDSKQSISSLFTQRSKS